MSACQATPISLSGVVVVVFVSWSRWLSRSRVLATMGQLGALLLVFTCCAGLPTSALAEQPGTVALDVRVGTPVMLSDAENVAVIKVGLRGLDIPVGRRPPVNLALVIDKSGSMSGPKIKKAKAAALMVLDRLHPDDILSVVAYDNVVRVLVPATRAAERQYIANRIHRLHADGSTALFAGVNKGIGEVRKFLERDQINRVILLSDGKANVGPRTPRVLGQLGAAAAKQGITITTIGLGLDYNEDLMMRLAMRSDGNHAFAESARDLHAIFSRELGDVLSVVAQNVQINISFGPFVRPLRVLNRDARVSGSGVSYRLNQVYANQEKYLLVEVAVPASLAGSVTDVAHVAAVYSDPYHRQTDHLDSVARVRFTTSSAEVERNIDREVMIAQAEATANEANERAVALRDMGRVGEAEALLYRNYQELDAEAGRWQSQRLRDQAASNRDDSTSIRSEQQWRRSRKSMRKRQHSITNNQSY